MHFSVVPFVIRVQTVHFSFIW